LCGRIRVLESDAGQQLNGKLAEIIEIQQKTGRIRVLMTLKHKVKAASIKPENLALELSVLDAAKKAIKTDPKIQEMLRGTALNSDDLNEKSWQMNDRLPQMSASEIVRRIRDNDIFLIQALNIPEELKPRRLEATVVVEMFELGLVDVCLDKFAFPDAINCNGGSDCFKHRLCLNLLPFIFATIEKDGPYKEFVYKRKNEILEKTGPLIMTTCTKKHRYYNHTYGWLTMQRQFLILLRSCFVVVSPVGIKTFLQMDALVLESLAEHIVLCMCVDPRLYLNVRKESIDYREILQKDNLQIKLEALFVLKTLLSVEDFGDAFGTLIGEVVVPGGALGLTGRRFAECFLDCASSFTVLKQQPEYESTTVVAALYCIYHEFWECSKLRPILGAFDGAFLSVASNSDFESWAQARLTK